MARREDWQKPAVRTKDWQGPSRRIGKSQSASCLPPFHRGCSLLVPLFTTILSALLPYLGCFLLLVPLLTLIVTHVVATLDVSCSCHRCLPIATMAVATWDVSSLLVVLFPSPCHHG